MDDDRENIVPFKVGETTTPSSPQGEFKDDMMRYMGDAMTLIDCVLTMAKGDYFAAMERLRIAQEIIDAVRPRAEGPF